MKTLSLSSSSSAAAAVGAAETAFLKRPQGLGYFPLTYRMTRHEKELSILTSAVWHILFTMITTVILSLIRSS